MLLSHRCRSAFDSIICARGEEYSRSGRVRSLVPTANGVRASVAGSGRPYSVVLDWGEAATARVLHAQCTCPYYEEGDFCKHIWAVLLQADARGLSASVPGRGKLVLEHQWEDPDLIEESDDEEDDDWEERSSRRYSTRSHPVKPMAPAHSHRPRSALSLFKEIASDRPLSEARLTSSSYRAKQIYFVLNLPGNQDGDPGLQIDFWHRARKADGTWGELRSLSIARGDLERVEDPQIRALLETLISLNEGSPPPAHRSYGYDPAFNRKHAGSRIPSALIEPVLRELAQSGRLLLASNPDHPLSFDDQGAFTLALEAERVGAAEDRYLFRGFLQRGEERLDLSDRAVALPPRFVVFGERITRFDPPAHLAWVEAFINGGEVRFNRKQADQVVESVLSDPSAPEVKWPTELHWRTLSIEPGIRALFRMPRSSGERGRRPGQREDERARFPLTLEFDYQGSLVPSFASSNRVLDPVHRRAFERNMEFERAALERVEKLGVIQPARPQGEEEPCSFLIEASRFAAVCEAMLEWGWRVEAAGKKVLSGGVFSARVSSGVDWFDLKGGIEFEGASLGLLALIEAIERGEKWVRLGDGAVGLLPEKWLGRLREMGISGKKSADGLRFNRVQGLFLDGWLAEARLKADSGFTHFRRKIRSFSGVHSISEPPGFQGELRPYQKEGLGWLSFLGDFGLGGILADDMGLGKTIQVIALLLSKHRLKPSGARIPSLAIVPKSLVGNWVSECARFAPGLGVLDHTGLQRRPNLEHFSRHDLIVTTYQTLRRDIETLKDLKFRYLIADEAQNIKNPESLASKCCRILQAERKIAMTGTPVENGLDDLFSILEFVNPGLITAAARERYRAGGPESGASIESLSRALRPVILRRAKAEVLKDLPAKTEQTLFCELGKEERLVYEGLRDHYRAKLAHQLERDGMARSKVQILTALLRLRQAACHPGLLGTGSHEARSSAKLDLLMEQLREATSEGHKCLVFSQFTSFLAIVARRFEKDGLDFEYLDGKTRDRQARVRSFHEDGRKKVFLVSLKAGGTGLNLTAADYVFLLDPWWNPAVESQAIDRAHRIGQRKKVFAYRLIARGTVEERILELQKGKRELADRIIASDSSFIRKMTREDLDVLLS